MFFQFLMAFPPTVVCFCIPGIHSQNSYLNHASSSSSRSPPHGWVSLISLCSLAVRQAREAALDAQLLVVATDLGKEKATQLFAEGHAFDPILFAEHLVSEFIVYTHYHCIG